MSRFNVGLIRVITLTRKKQLNAHSELLKKYFKDLCIHTKCIQDQPEGIHDEQTERQAVPKIIQMAKQLEKLGCNAVIISCAADPAVQECRAQINIPVIGAGSSAASIAVGIGQNIGVIGITHRVPRIIQQVLGNKFKYYIRPEGINNTLDLYNQNSKNNILSACKHLKDMGCDVVLLACTGMSTINISTFIQKQIDIKVVDPVIATGVITEYLRLSK